MQAKTHISIWTKFTVYITFAMILCIFCQPILAQSLTAKDSTNFHNALLASHTDFDRINYELKLAEYSIRKPGSYKIDLDNARMWIGKAKKLNAQLKSKESAGHILFEEFYLLQEGGPSPKGKEMIQAVIPLLKDGTDKSLLAIAYKELSYYYSLENPAELNTKIDLIKESITLFKQSDNKFKTANTLQYLADLYVNSNNYPMALKTIRESLAIYNSIHFQQIQGTYDLFAQINYAMADYNNCLKYELLALKTSEQLKDSTMQACEINNHVGLTLEQLQQVNKSVTYFKAAQLLAIKNKNLNSNLEVSLNLADCYNNLYKPNEALGILHGITSTSKNIQQDDHIKTRIDCSYLVTFIQLKQFNQANTYVEKLLGLLKSPLISINSISNIYNQLIYYYFTTKDYNNELIFLVKYQRLAEQIGEPAVEMNNLGSWYKLDSARNDYKLAFNHLLKYKALRDSIFSEKKSRQIGQMQIQYETQKKEDEIRLKNQDIKILTQNAKIDQVQLKAVQISRNVTLAGIIVFIVIAGMQYRRYHEKQKINLLITEKNATLQILVQEKEWLLKEVHHRVKNNLHTVICLLESQAAYLENDALKAVESSQHRIFAMSLIHQRLYQSTDSQTIEMAMYLPEFIVYLRESFGSPININFQQEIESLRLDVSQAIPLALIVNEAVTNSIKYAFPESRNGVIKIILQHESDLIRLIIADNGIGISGSIESDDLTSLGLELIRGLTNDLKGNVQILVEKGTSIIVSFKKGPFSTLK